MQKPIRQGDILLMPRTDSVAGAEEEIKDGVLARGEATGHSHRIEGGKVLRNSNGQILVEIEPKQEAKLVHEEHDLHELDKGIYEVRRQREYNPIEHRQVMD